MTADSVSFLAIQSEEMMFCYGYDISGTEVFCCLTKTDVNFNNREIIKITYIEDGYNIIPIAAIKFNSMQNEYYVVCDEYKSAYLSEDYNKIITCLDRDIVNGEVGDIIVFEDISALHKYAARGVLEDIYTLKNKTLEKENIFDCVKSLCELDGKLYAIPREFKVETLIASATNPIISNNWTLWAYLAAVASIGEGTKMLKQTSRNGLLNILIPYVVTEFVDIESGSCTFDGEQFNEFLSNH